MDSEQLTRIREWTEKSLSESSDSSHDWDHIKRVTENAKLIVEHLRFPDIDLNLLEACCLLHDICYSQYKQSIYTHLHEARLSVNILTKAFQTDLNFIDKSEQQIILEAVQFHPFSIPYRRLNKNRSLYTRILQDADSLDYFHPARPQKITDRTIAIIYKYTKWIYDYCLNHLEKYLNFPELAYRCGRVRRLPLDYSQSGQTSGKTILIISGYASNPNAFKLFQERLSDKFNVIVLKLPTVHGHFQKLKIEELSWYVDRLVEEKKLDNFDLAGFSLGGLVAVSYASSHPEKISRLVLLSCFPVLIVKKANLCLYRLFKPVLTSGWFARIYVLFNTNDIIRKLWGSQSANKADSEVMMKNPEPIFTTFFENLGTNFVEQFNQMKVPKTIFSCLDDRIFRWEKYRHLKDKLNAEFVLSESGGHNLTEDYQINASKLWLETK